MIYIIARLMALPHLWHIRCDAQTGDCPHHDISGNSGFFRSERGTVVTSSSSRRRRVHGFEQQDGLLG